MVNFTTIIGNLTKNPELRYTSSGTPVCNMRLASSRKYKSGDEMREETLFITVVVWGKRGENCEKYLKKGVPVFIQGHLQSRSWDGSDGKKQYATELVAENVQFLNRTKEGTSAEEETFGDE